MPRTHVSCLNPVDVLVTSHAQPRQPGIHHLSVEYDDVRIAWVGTIPDLRRLVAALAFEVGAIEAAQDGPACEAIYRLQHACSHGDDTSAAQAIEEARGF